MSVPPHDQRSDPSLPEVLPQRPMTTAPHETSVVRHEHPLVVRPGKSRLRWITIVSVLIIGGILAWYWLWPTTPSIAYKTARVDRGPITAIVTATGSINPVVSVEVGSQVSGRIAKLYADFNSVVHKGQVLASIEQNPFKARVNQARAALKSAKGNLAKAKNMVIQRRLERERMATLREQRFVSQSDLDLAQTNYRDAVAHVEVAEAEVDRAQAALVSAELDLGYTTIISPVNGIVVSRNVDEGQTVIATFQTPILFVIAQDLSRMQVNANVSESDIGGVTQGKPADFRVDAYPRELFHGTVTQVRNAPVSIQNVVTYDVIIAVDNRDLKLKPGMTADIAIVTAQKEDPLRVPNTALRFKMPGIPKDRKEPHLWVKDPAGPLRDIPATTGISDSLFTEILQGDLNEGDEVIVGIETEDEGFERTLPPGFGIGPKVR